MEDLFWKTLLTILLLNTTGISSSVWISKNKEEIQRSQCFQFRVDDWTRSCSSNLTYEFFICDDRTNFSSSKFLTAPGSNISQWIDNLRFSTYLFKTKKQDAQLVCDNEESISSCAWNITEQRGNDFSIIVNDISDFIDENGCDITKTNCPACDLSNVVGTSGYLMVFPVLILVYTLAILSLVGNAFVIMYNIQILTGEKKAVRTSVQNAQSMMILNLSLADFLTGTYLFILSIVATGYQSGFVKTVYRPWLVSDTCTALAIINFLSTQVSVLTLVIITTVRMYSVLHPYKNMQIRPLAVTSMLTWLVGVIIAFVPVFTFEKKGSILVKNGTRIFFQPRLYSTVEFFLSEIEQTYKFGHNRLHEKLLEGNSWKNLLDLCRKLKLIQKDDADSLLYQGYYNFRETCSLSYYYNDKPNELKFTLSVVGIYIVSFIYVVVGYVVINGAVAKHHAAQDRYCCLSRFAINWCKKPANQREEENRCMNRKIFCIIVTDFLAVIPISIASIYFQIKTSMGERYDFWKYWHEINAITLIMLAINSATNPILYSYSLWKDLIIKMRRYISDGSTSEIKTSI
ncbi:relaxin receptor 2-like [Clavelina lepadiformis]|uniref:relaxin receptor 2-like n=1 Tax=Clavelina lepadiformis TaxID=159417 RepID=UPI0040420906